VPVWHAATREMRARGEFLMVGITQEQHPERCRLFAQWQGFDFPILWDPFNLLGVSAVPIVTPVDEHGVVRAGRWNPRDAGSLAAFRSEFVDARFDAPGALPEQRLPVDPSLLDNAGRPQSGAEQAAEAALATLLFQHWNEGPGMGAAIDGAVAELGRVSGRAGAPPDALFRYGVARRLRYDSPYARADDFQASIDAWVSALAANPNQYIWRRRIQQWGPRLDKPYPFYDWVEQALAEVAARGETPPVLVARLTASERAAQTNELPRGANDAPEPDPEGEIERDTQALVRVECAAALHTGFASRRLRVAPGTARVHVSLRPSREADTHWGDDAGPALVWIDPPQGWAHEGRLFTLAAGEGETPGALRGIDFELVPPQGPPVAGAELTGYALYFVCSGADGQCVYRRQDFAVALPLPPAADDGK
jgi:hypothetical protein